MTNPIPPRIAATRLLPAQPCRLTVTEKARVLMGFHFEVAL